jgi:hypothetical protein
MKSSIQREFISVSILISLMGAAEMADMSSDWNEMVE